MTGIHENAAFTRSRSNFTDVRTFEEQSETLDQKTFTSHLEFRETEASLTNNIDEQKWLMMPNFGPVSNTMALYSE